MMHHVVWIVEPESKLNLLLLVSLASHGIGAEAFDNGEEAWQRFESGERPSLILMNVRLQAMSGYEFCTKIRRVSTVPIIFLSDTPGSSDLVAALEIGGDDYIVKPIDFYSLIARIKSQLRRAEITARKPIDEIGILKSGELKIDLYLNLVSIGGEPLPISTKEYRLLVTLVRSPNRTFSPSELCRSIWGSEDYGEADALKVHLHHLRKKLKACPKFMGSIRTSRGKGYSYDPGIKLYLLC